MDAQERLSRALADRYRIEREIGSGGMATVYLAEDLKHGRPVAVKVFRADLAAHLGSERFHREIQIAAQLQHPNILPLYDSGEADGFLFYVMPYVEGTSLRDKLDQEGELPIREAVRILRDTADALTEAHANGVVHRDIKPANILIRGRHALVADFGVAKAVSEATGRQQLTTGGVALGTPSYMAPEQASADPHLDHRVDIYALGAVAYEMLTGRPVFLGVTPQSILAAHMTETPQPVRELRESVPVALEQLVMRCLEKKPADRWQTAEELLPVLEGLSTPSGGLAPVSGATAATRARPMRWLWPALLVFAIAVAVLALFLGPDDELGIAFGAARQVTAEQGLEIHPAISPDGNLVAFAAGPANRMRVYVRSVGGGRVFPITDTATEVQSHPRWSPDGSALLYLSGGNLYSAPRLGGTARRLVAGSTRDVASGDWSPDGDRIVFLRGDSLQVVGLSGGATRLLALLPDGHSCVWSPRGDLVACVQGNDAYVNVGTTFGNLAPSRIVLVPPSGGAPRVVAAGGHVNQSPAFSGDGRVLFYVSNRDGTRDIHALRITEDGTVAGEPERLSLGLQAQSISVARDAAKLVYSVYRARANIWAMPIPGAGPVDISGAKPVTTGNQVVETMRVSRDGEWLLYDSNLRGNSDIYRIPIDGGAPEQLTHAPVDEFAPDLSPDGTELAYHTFETGSRDIGLLPLEGGSARLLTSSPAQESYPVWSPDGASIAFFDQSGIGNPVFLLERGPGGSWTSPRHLVDSLAHPQWSADGRYLAGVLGAEQGLGLVEARGGELRTLYEPTPGSGEPRAWRPRWSRDGRLLYFRSYDASGTPELWSISATGGRPRLRVRYEGAPYPSIRPDFAVSESRVFFTIQERESDIWLRDLLSE